MIARRALLTGLVAALTTVSVGACSGQSTQQPAKEAAPAAATTPAASASPAASGPVDGPPLAITDPWVKTTKKGMTAAFGTLVNNTDIDMTVVSASSPLSPKVELHEVADSGGKAVMRPKKGGFVIPARGTHQLQPGSDHIMLMKVTKKVQPGAQIPLTLTLQGGETLEFTAIAKDFAGGQENYQPGTDQN